MTIKMLLAAALVSLAACAADPAAPTVDAPDGSGAAIEKRVEEAPSQDTDTSEPGACELLPNDDSTCAHACDADFIETHVPAGQCAVFPCVLTDGSVVNFGGCNGGQ